MKPRYKPMWGKITQEHMLGYAGELDVWIDRQADEPYVFVVGPEHRKLLATNFNFDGHPITETGVEWTPTDVHIELHEMCRIIELLQEDDQLPS